MLIAIDFDDTLTADPVMFRTLIAVVKSFGHNAVCVTARPDTNENRMNIEGYFRKYGIELYVHYTAGASKVYHTQRIGLKVDIWIDDDMRKCAMCH